MAGQSARGDVARDARLERLLAAQAAYFVATGIWPLLHRRSFEAVTGPKADYWLVQTVGVLVTVLGASIGRGLRRGDPAPETRLAAVAAALGLAGIDVLHVSRRRISVVYLADAALELFFAASLLREHLRRRARATERVHVFTG